MQGSSVIIERDLQDETENGNVAVPICQHCAEPERVQNSLQTMPCGRRVHLISKLPHLENCDECHTLLTGNQVIAKDFGLIFERVSTQIKKS